MADDLANLQVRITGDASDLEATISSVQAQLAGLEQSQRSSTSQTATASRETASYRNTLADTGRRISSVGQSIDTLTRPLQYVSAGLAAGGVAAAKFAIDFENNFADVKKTVDGTPEQLEAVKQGIVDLTTTGINGRSAIPQTTAELTKLAAAGGQLGIQTPNILEFTETMAQMGTATNLAGESGAQTMARFMNVTGTSQDKVKNLGSAVVDLGNNYATTEAEIMNMALNMGATGNVIGMSAQDILGYSTALSSMGVEAEAGGSAVSRIWMDMQSAVSSGGEELEQFAELSGKSAEDFAQKWKTDASGAFQDFLQGLSKSDDQIGTLSELGFNNIRDIQALQRLASEQGFGMLTDAIQRSNTAWQENNALQTEFDNKSDTTASKLQITRNNLVEAARGIGETFLPSIMEGSEKVASFAQRLSQMDDAQKKSLVNTGTTLIAIGAGAKVASTGIKTVGDTITAIGKIRDTKVWSGISAGLAAIPLPARLATAGLVTLGVVAKGVYDDWYDSTYNWSEGMTESVSKVQETSTALQSLNGYQNELKDLKIIINSDESSQSQIEEAKGRIKEIAELLAEEYNLKINADTTDVDAVTAAVEKAQQMKRSDFDYQSSNFKSYLSENYDKFRDNKELLESTQAEYDNAQKLQMVYGDLKSSLTDLYNAYDNGEISLEAYTERSKEAIQAAKEAGADVDANGNIAGALSKSKKAYEEYSDALDPAKEKSVASRLNSLKESQKEFNDTATEYADISLEMLKSDISTGNVGNQTKDIENMSYAIKKAGLDANEYAGKVALAQNQLGSFSELAGKGGDVINKTVADYQKAAQQFGTTGIEIAQSSSLIKNGLNSVGDIDSKDTLNAVLSDFDTYAKDFKLNSGEIALGTSLIQQGFDSVQSAIDAGKINEVFEAFEANGKEMGLDNSQIIEFANALNLIPEDKHIEISAEGDLSLVDNVTEKLTNIDGKPCQINIDANGDVTILDTATNKLRELQGIGAVTMRFDAEGNIEFLNEAQEVVATLNKESGVVVQVDAEGNVEVLDEAGNKINELQGMGAVSVHLNAEGNTDVLNEAGEKIAEIDGKTGTVTLTATDNVTPAANNAGNSVNNIPSSHNSSLTATDGVSGPANAATSSIRGIPTQTNSQLSATDNASSVARGVSSVLAGIPRSIQIVISAVATGVQSVINGIKGNAKGTQNFTGGLAMVNDEQGVYDNRELIVDKGRAFIPQGENVILPLSKGAKVYTASQTKAIMQGLGIPRYASGKDNSDAFTAAKDDWTHYTKIHAVTTSEELEKWVELSEEFTDNEQDVADIQEEIFSLTQKIADELNKESAAYIEERSALNDWSQVGDSAIDAFNRVKDRNYQDLQDGKLTWQDYVDTISDLGSDMLSDRLDQSEDWLRHEEKYNGMSTDDYLAGINRMRAYTQEYYDVGIISHRQYVETLKDLDEEYFDKQKEQLEEQKELLEELNAISKKWVVERSYFNDWQDFDDDPISAYNRVKDRVYSAFENGEISWDEYAEQMADIGTTFLDSRLEQSEKWLSEQRKYFGMTEDEYIAGLDRMKDYTEQYYELGIISRRERNEAITDLDHKLWDMQEEMYEDSLQKQADYISDLRSQFSRDEQELRDSWAVSDRRTDMASVRADMSIYRYAVTEQGQEKYKDLQEQLKQLEREEEMYQLEQEHQATLDELQAQYDEAEAQKAVTLARLRAESVDIANTSHDIENISVDISDYCQNINDSVLNYQGVMTNLIYSVIDAINKVSVNVYNDNSTINSSSSSASDIKSNYKIAWGYYG